MFSSHFLRFGVHYSRNDSSLIYSQVFLLTVCFGLFHGLVFFPVLLSIFGPHDHPQSASGAPAESSGHVNSGFSEKIDTDDNNNDDTVII